MVTLGTCLALQWWSWALRVPWRHHGSAAAQPPFSSGRAVRDVRPEWTTRKNDMGGRPSMVHGAGSGTHVLTEVM